MRQMQFQRTGMPQAKTIGTKVPGTRSTGLSPVIGVIVLSASAALVWRGYFSGENQAPERNLPERTKLQGRLQENDDSEQYALLANADGWYPCNHAGRIGCYLLAGEVWKYGTTTKGQLGRYNFKYLQQMEVSYFVQFQGTLSECLKEEQRKLFHYPYLPENMARPAPDRLPRPPFNSKMQ